jgi:hypothetical protein
MPVEKTLEERKAEPLDPKTFGMICPKDPNRDSVDPAKPPTHLACEVTKLEIDDRPMFSPQEVAAGKKRRPTVAHLLCNTCGHEFTVKPWPYRAGASKIS